MLPPIRTEDSGDDSTEAELVAALGAWLDWATRRAGFVCNRLNLDGATADDLAQELYLLLQRRGMSVSPGAGFQSWCLSALVHLAQREVRSRIRYQGALHRASDCPDDRSAASASDPESGAEGLSARIIGGLGDLRPAERRAVERLIAEAGDQSKVVSALVDELGLTIGQARWRTKKALEFLERRLEAYPDLQSRRSPAAAIEPGGDAAGAKASPSDRARVMEDATMPVVRAPGAGRRGRTRRPDEEAGRGGRTRRDVRERPSSRPVISSRSVLRAHPCSSRAGQRKEQPWIVLRHAVSRIASSVGRNKSENFQQARNRAGTHTWRPEVTTQARSTRRLCPRSHP